MAHSAAVAYLDYRTHGEEARKMSELTGSKEYKDYEVARPDKFINPYIGRDYKGVYTEVLSMGFQYLYQGAGDFYRRDPDHFLFTMGVISREASYQKDRRELWEAGKA